MEVESLCALAPYRIEDERPIPVNGFCSFIVVSEIPDSDGIGDLVAQALNGMAR